MKIWLIQDNEGRFLKSPGMYAGKPPVEFTPDFTEAWIFRSEKQASDVLVFESAMVEYELTEKRRGVIRIDWVREE